MGGRKAPEGTGALQDASRGSVIKITIQSTLRVGKFSTRNPNALTDLSVQGRETLQQLINYSNGGNSLKGGQRWSLWFGMALLVSAMVLNAEAIEPYELSNSWAFTMGCRSDSSPAVGDDRTIYLGAWDGKVRAITPSGSLKWAYPCSSEIKSSPAIGADGTIYIGCRDRFFYAITSNGQRKWKFKTGGWVDSSAALATDGTIYFGSWDKRFYALNQDGTRKWDFPTAGEIVSSAAVGADDTIYFGSHDKKLYALRPDGTKKWEFVAGGQIVCSPAINGSNCVYFGSVNGLFYAVNLDGTERWRLRTGGVGEGSPIIGPEGSIYVGVNDYLWGISADGKKQWQRPGEGFVDATCLMFANGHLCFASRPGHIITLHPLEGRQMKWWHYIYGEAYASPAVSSDGMVYVPSHEAHGSLCALYYGQPLAKTPWPKFRGNSRNTGNVKDIH